MKSLSCMALEGIRLTTVYFDVTLMDPQKSRLTLVIYREKDHG